MKLLLQPNSWSCMPTSFAMVAGTSVEEVIKYIGHDGGQITNYALDDPFRRRSFGLNECIAYMIDCAGYAVTPVIMEFEYAPKGDNVLITANLSEDLLPKMMALYNGILVGHMQHSGTGHVAAWDSTERKVYCPTRGIQDLNSFGLDIESFLVCTPLSTMHRTCSGNSKSI